MKANFYRFLYENTNDGIVNTGSIVNTEAGKDFQFCYLSGAANMGTIEMDSIGKTGISFNNLPDTLDMLVLADFEPCYVDRALGLLEATKVKQIILPKLNEEVKENLINSLSEEVRSSRIRTFIEEPAGTAKSKGAGEICELGEGETLEKEVCGFKVKISCRGRGEKASLIMYYGPENKRTCEKECMFTVKSFTNDMNCSMCIDEDDHHCAMKCGLYNDFDVCRRHSEKDCEQYVLGTMLLGNVNLRECGQDILDDFREEIKSLRIMSIPDGGDRESWDRQFFEKAMDIFKKENPKAAHFKQYFVVPSCRKASAQTLMDISASDPYHQMVMTGKVYGICASGYLKTKED